MNAYDELIRMATISNIMLLQEKLGHNRVAYEKINRLKDDQLRIMRDELIVIYNEMVSPDNRVGAPDGCRIKKDGTIHSDVIRKGDE